MDGEKAMFQNVQVPPPQPQRKPRGGWGWLRVFFVGLLLFIATTIVLFMTDNPNLYPTVILIGNFLVPVTFVAFLYDHQHLSTLTPYSVMSCFCVGGTLGVIGASVLEAWLVPPSHYAYEGISLSSALLVGLIEEACKIVAVMIVARRMNHGSEMDGLLLGGAVGMGFAALESTGYAFTALLLSHGRLTASIVETVLRGLFAPFGHGVWTAILGAVLFRASEPRHFRITILVFLVYLFVSVLHGFWDGLPNTVYFIIPPGIPIPVVTAVLSLIGIVTLIVVYRSAVRRQLQQGPIVGS
jgi:RsiW-degrading membrane proteinase PrsW (M82 family)